MIDRTIQEARDEGFDDSRQADMCETCEYNSLDWHEEPCESCTVGGDENHWKPSAKPGYKTDHGYMWICPHCGLVVHSDYGKCVRCGYER